MADYKVKIGFSGELYNNMGIIASRFCEEAILGILSSGSVRLTDISRALEEKSPLLATHKRLSRNLADKNLEHGIDRKVLKFGSKHIKENTLLIVDPSDIQKKYARKMQYLSQVRDGSDGRKGILVYDRGGDRRLPECPERPLWLVVIKGFRKRPLMILTTEPVRRNRNVL